MLCFWRSVVPDSCRCGLQDLFEVEQGLRTREPWLGYPGLAAARNVQHPERHFQNPTSRDVFQAAICYRPAPFDQIGMYLHCPPMPRMPAVADFTDISNMGIALLSCIMRRGTTKGKATRSYSRPRESPGTGRAAESAVGSGSVDY